MNEEEFIVKTITSSIKRSEQFIISMVSIIGVLIITAIVYTELSLFLIGFLIFLSILSHYFVTIINKDIQKFVQGELNEHE